MPHQPTYAIPTLPFSFEVETKSVMRIVSQANRYLAELKGTARTIPNESILINTLTLQEAQDSSAVENIITTQDELFKAELFIDKQPSIATKEVQRYAVALRKGFAEVRQNKLLTLSHILNIQAALEQNRAGLRTTPGTTLKNNRTGEIVYVPPQHPDEIKALMSNLIQFINDESLSALDPLIKMAIIHHQFESIHPFYDGNGRTGRIINILYLVANDLLELPILYLSRYIIRNKTEYYRRLQAVRDHGDWEGWIIYLLQGVKETAQQSIQLIGAIRELMQQQKNQIRSQFPKIYSQDLLNNLFRHPYTKIEFIMNDLQVSRPTASNYLSTLAEEGLLQIHKLGRSNYYINTQLVSLLLMVHEE
ncbi:MAG: Fic family protein [Saprospiraceae bacterium]|nr:Fic family protein [Saprospiraceae bacterium]